MSSCKNTVYRIYRLHVRSKRCQADSLSRALRLLLHVLHGCICHITSLPMLLWYTCSVVIPCIVSPYLCPPSLHLPTCLLPPASSRTMLLPCDKQLLSLLVLALAPSLTRSLAALACARLSLVRTHHFMPPLYSVFH